ncbi:hypothetical protein BSKO_05275 [Bryopsis sp. KO-2023]|nr:hypothetical protein BSKO_05275 [Bryopsis sp. KO-2023]
MVVMSDFEREREEQIEKNNRVLMELGLHETLDRMQSNERKRKKARLDERRTRQRAKLELRQQEPVRQSSRLRGKAAPSYDENLRPRNSPRAARVRKPGFVTNIHEVYTMEQYESLDTFTKEWVMGIDGYDGDKRVYSSEGATCHQCRQKTLGKRTSCSECGSHYGIFCGDCLWARYGANLDELPEAWKCPSCRGICNCSICRNRKGWAPTGQLYWHVKSEGYASVAHYIVANHLEQPQKGESVKAKPEKPQATKKDAEPDPSNTTRRSARLATRK